MSTLVITDVLPRLTAAATAVRSSRDAYHADLELRDALVVAAIDNGLSQRAVARAAGFTGGRVAAILSQSQPDD